MHGHQAHSLQRANGSSSSQDDPEDGTPETVSGRPFHRTQSLFDPRRRSDSQEHIKSANQGAKAEGLKVEGLKFAV